jgi:septation ring formation regulator EzrA
MKVFHNDIGLKYKAMENPGEKKLPEGASENKPDDRPGNMLQGILRSIFGRRTEGSSSMKPNDVHVMRQQMEEAIDAAISSKVTPQLQKISGDVGSVQSDITAFKSDVSQISSDVTALKSNVSQINSGLTETQTDVRTLKTGQNTANERLQDILNLLKPPKP